MNYIVGIFVFLLLLGCKSNVNNAYEKEFLVINNKNFKSVAFQSNYAKRIFQSDTTQTVFFDIDKKTVNYINNKINKEYCLTEFKWNNQLWDKTKTTEEFKKNKEYLNEYEYFKKCFLIDCNSTINELDYYDRQFIGMNSPNGKKIIFIQFLDLRDDTHKIKELLETDFLNIIGDNFERSKYKRIVFLVDEKRFVYTTENI